MYHWIVRRIVRRNIECLNSGDYESLLKSYGFGIKKGHSVSGDHPLGGVRHSVEAMRRYYERLHRLLPDLQVDIRNIIVSGRPGRTLIALEWCDRATAPDGLPYTNEGVQIIEIHWGRIVSSCTYPDTQRVVEVCKRLTATGVIEAAASPIED
jgi:ketosteroid isomerase-like protein